MPEKIIAPLTRADGSTWDIAFSKDTAQQVMYVVDGKNMKVHILKKPLTVKGVIALGSPRSGRAGPAGRLSITSF